MESLNNPMMKGHRIVWMEGSAIHLLDQRELPHQEIILSLHSYQQSTAAIRDMAVRGAGTIGITAGFAMAQAALTASSAQFWNEMEQAAAHIKTARPTAHNLFYAVDRVFAALQSVKEVERARRKAVEEAQAFYEEEVRMTHAIAQAGLSLIPPAKAVMTHCNAGWLAYPGWGTALAPIYLAHANNKAVFVYANETRPRSQGAKLTTWELQQAGVPHALLADTAAGFMMKKGEIGLVIVGADRIAANGDTANKIGTYTVAILAKAHNIPFYVAAPSSTFDAHCPMGEQIPIEERDEQEVLEASGRVLSGDSMTVRVATPGTTAKNPAFDVTPSSLITGFITECGIVAPTIEALSKFLTRAADARRSTVAV